MEIKEIVKKIVNIWDPLGVYGLAPKDEYDDITENIIKLLKEDADRDVIRDFLLNQYYNDNAKSDIKVDELIDTLIILKKENKFYF